MRFLVPLLTSILGLGVAGLTPVVAFAETQPPRTIVVSPDLATVLKLPAGTAAVVLGNPAIADVVITSSGVAVITGKAAGTTNIIVQDDTGEMLATLSVEVRANSTEALSVYRGTQHEGLVCRPRCESAPQVQAQTAAPAAPPSKRPAAPP
jgi:hypothetical protein